MNKKRNTMHDTCSTYLYIVGSCKWIWTIDPYVISVVLWPTELYNYMAVLTATSLGKTYMKDISYETQLTPYLLGLVVVDGVEPPASAL